LAATFTTVRKIVTGPGSLRELGPAARELGLRRVLLVSGGQSQERSGALARAREYLRGAGVEFEEHAGVLAEPDLAAVELLRGRLREGFDAAVSIGGGSVIDAAKAGAGLVREDAPAREYQAGREIRTAPLPHIAIPTTAGSGAEVTPNAVITDPDGPRKVSIRDPRLLPAVAIVDPELALGLPPQITATSGMDALAQAIESYVSIHATPLTEALSLQAISLLARGLVAAVEEGSNLEARTDCAYGALSAGIALANARLGVIHGVAHPLGARTGLPHGLVCAVLLAPAIRMNEAACGAKLAEVARRLAAGFSQAGARGVTVSGLTPEDLARRAPRADVLVEALLERLSLPKRLAVRLRAEDVRAIVSDSMPSGSLKANPKKVSPADVEALLAEVVG